MSSQTSSLTGLPASLAEARITSLPPNMYYIPNFITIEEEKRLLEKIATAPKPRWKQLSKRRLQTWPSDLTQTDTLLDAPLPTWLTNPIIPRLLSLPTGSRNAAAAAPESSHIFDDSPHGGPNHVLINEYLPGQGIMPHKDGSSYFPVVCTVSLGGSLCLDVYGCRGDGTREEVALGRVLQEERSLLVTCGEGYTEVMHGIADVEVDEMVGSKTVSNWSLLGCPGAFESGSNVRGTRISLTYRDVLKVSKLGSKLGLILKH